jgi:hypothetical protein
MGNEPFRLERASDSFAGRHWPLDLWSTSGVWPREVHRWSSRWDALFHEFRDAAGSRGGFACSCAAASSEQSASCAISGACALASSSPRDPFFWDSSRSFPPGCADRRIRLPEKAGRGTVGSFLMSCKNFGHVVQEFRRHFEERRDEESLLFDLCRSCQSRAGAGSTWSPQWRTTGLHLDPAIKRRTQ